MSTLSMSILTPEVFMIVCPLVFLAGLLDAVAGGGALVSIPAYLLAGIPVHTAIATNKLSASFGATMSAAYFIKSKSINFKIGIPSVACGIIGSVIGANLSMHMDEAIMMKALLIILPLTAFTILNKRIFHDNPDKELIINRRLFAIVMTIAFVIGIYDGFFGPGAGTFIIICFTVFCKMSIAKANAQAKLINLTTTVTAMVIFLMNGQILIPLGIAAGICNMLGSRIGAGLVMKKGAVITKPAMLMVLGLLSVKIIGIY